jgi:hypothetical protein
MQTALSRGTPVTIRAIVGATGPHEEDLGLLGRRGAIVACWREADGLHYAVALADYPDYPPLAFTAAELGQVRD